MPKNPFPDESPEIAAIYRSDAIALFNGMDRLYCLYLMEYF